MKRMILSCLALLAALSLLAAEKDSPAAAASTPTAAVKADPRVAAVLKALEYEYDLTDDQDYKLTFELEDKRTQLVFLNSNTELYDKAEIREIWSPAFSVDDPMDPALAQRLLKANDTYKLGGWRLWPAEAKNGKAQLYVVFAAQVDANAPQAMISAALDMVSQTADDLEKEIIKADEH